MGDAYAAAVEYLKKNSQARERFYAEAMSFHRYLEHPTHGHPAGFYTDDAEMSVGCASAISFVPLDQLNPDEFVFFWLREFVRGGNRKGYARGFQAFLEEIVADCHVPEDVIHRHVVTFLDRIRPDSRKNGACMRAVPLGVISDIQEALRISTMQAAITHNTPEGLFSARAVTAMAHFALYQDEPLRNLPLYCKDNLPPEDERWFYVFDRLWPDGKAVRSYNNVSVAIATTHAVCSHLKRFDSLRGIMMQIIQDGGDTDSVAAIAWGIASCRMQDEVLPDFLEYALEGGSPKTGTIYLTDLGTQLMDTFSN